MAKVDSAFPKKLVASEPLIDEYDWEARWLLAELEPLIRAGHDMSISQLVHYRDSLPAFTPIGFVYVLPGYLKYAITEPGSDLAQRLIIHFAGAPEHPAIWNARLEFLNSEQRTAIDGVLRYICLVGQAACAEVCRDAVTGWEHVTRRDR